MEHKDILQSIHLDSTGEIELNGSGKWTRFIATIYLVFSFLILVIAILVLLNVERIVSELIKFNGMSEQALQFMIGAGRWLFAIMMILSAFILSLNGYFLIRFGTNCKLFFINKQEIILKNTFSYLEKYFMLTAILSFVSTFFTIALIVFYLVK